MRGALAISALALAAARDQGPRLGVEVLRRDFEVMRAALEEGDPGLHRHAPKAELDRAFQAVRLRIVEPMNEVEFFRLVAPLAAAIRDGHLRIILSRGSQEWVDAHWPILPLEVRWLSNRLFVLRDHSTSDGSLAGAEIQSVEGIPADDLVYTMLPMAPRDGRVQSSPTWWLNRGFRFGTLFAINFGPRPQYRIGYRPRTGGPAREIELSGESLNGLEKGTPTAANAELRFSGDRPIAILTVRAFAHTASAQPMEEFFQDAFTEIEKRGPRALIIDVRDNGGGWDHLGSLLLAHLLDRPFRYYDGIFLERTTYSFGDPFKQYRFQRERGRIRLASHSNFGIQRPVPPVFQGKVFVIMNGGSFSTTSEFLSTTQDQHRATFIGEESGGGYCGTNGGEFAHIALPGTGLRIEIPLMRYELAVKCKNPDRGVLPDEPVSPTIDDLLSGRDVYLDRALALASAASTRTDTPERK